MGKIVFFDIDGTLLDHEKKLPISTKQAVQALKDEGHNVVIATGRAPFLFEDIREELKIESYVSFNGQYVVLDGEVIYKNPINEQALKSLSNFANLKEHPLVFMANEEMKANVTYHSHIDECLQTLGAIHPEECADYYLEKEIYQSLLFCKETHENEYAETFNELNFIRWHSLSMDVIPFRGSKAQGIKQFIDKVGYQRENVYAFGDNLNDIEMLQFVGHGVAMGNAPDVVKNAAKYVTKDVSDDGIVYGLELVGLLK